MSTRKIVRRHGITELTQLSLPTIYRLMQRGEFPASIRLSSNAVGWDMQEVQEWIEGRKANTRRGGLQ